MATFTIPYDAISGYSLKLKANTGITDLGVGKEQRRANWANIQRAWDLIFRKDSADLTGILNFWEARLGAWDAFDWTDPDGVARKVRFLNDELQAGPIINGYGTIKLTLLQVFDSDNSPPTVSSVSPLNGANSGGLNTNVIWVMSEPISISDVTATYFHVIDSTTGASVDGTLTLTTAGTIVIFDPTNAWINSRSYLPRVEAGVHDLSGNKLATAYGTRFNATSS